MVFEFPTASFEADVLLFSLFPKTEQARTNSHQKDSLLRLVNVGGLEGELGCQVTDRIVGLLVLAPLEATNAEADVALVVARVNLQGQVKPLPRILELPKEILATADIVNASQMPWLYV